MKRKRKNGFSAENSDFSDEEEVYKPVVRNGRDRQGSARQQRRTVKKKKFSESSESEDEEIIGAKRSDNNGVSKTKELSIKYVNINVRASVLILSTHNAQYAHTHIQNTDN